MNETRESGLAQSIPASNIGHKMLSAMGYTGGGIGRSQGRAEPVAVSVKVTRTGLGMDTHVANVEKQKLEQQTEVAKAHIAHFREHKSSEVSIKLQERDIVKAKRVCENLDRLNSIDSNPLWNPTEEELNAEGKITDPYTDIRKEIAKKRRMDPALVRSTLRELLLYLRSTYCYCIYCAIRFDSEDDLAANCPGMDMQDHEEEEDLGED